MSDETEEMDFDDFGESEDMLDGRVDWAGFVDKSREIPGTPIPGMMGYRHMTDAEYRKFPAVNNSLLKFATAAEMHEYLTSPQKQSKSLAIGTLLDIAALEPEAHWEDRFHLVDVPVNPTTGKPYQAGSKKHDGPWEEARAANPGKHLMEAEAFTALLDKKTGLLKQMLRSIQDNADAWEDICASEKHASGILWHPRWECWVKWQPDLLRKIPRADRGRYITDLKSCSRHPMAFPKNCWQFGYFGQAAWYAACDQELCRQAVGPSAPVCRSFDFIVVSTPDPKKYRPTMCRTFTTPIDAVVSPGIASAHRNIGLPEGTGRVDIFLDSLRNHLRVNPAPDDTALIRTIWPAYEQETAEKNGRTLLIG